MAHPFLAFSCAFLAATAAYSGASSGAAPGALPAASGEMPAQADSRPVIRIDVPEVVPTADSNGEIPGSKDVPNVVRETVSFGRFYEDASQKELKPIKWIVLDKKDGYSLLMTRQIVESKGWMETGKGGAAWAESDLRRWLDGAFYDTAFSPEEKKHMALFDAVQPQNPRYSTPAGKSTIDPVSILSYQELIHFMPTNLERRTSPTDYAAAKGCYQNRDGDGAWWLRSPGPKADVPEHLASWGNLGARTHLIDDATIGVRPVIWVESQYLSKAE